MRVSPRRRQSLRARIRAGQAEHLVACADQFPNYGRADKSCSTGDKDYFSKAEIVSV